ncbi:MAG: hypothetical protein GC200_09970 [Tepidisphaera sp.]|nr:hypothetical protein [Tepidisphaera sp.]
MKTFVFVGAAALALAAGMANAQVNGQYKPAYGAPLALQTNGTGFGNSTSGDALFANGSELDGVYAYAAGGNLNLLLTGNLESNYNKLSIFIDNGSGQGQNVLDNSTFFGLEGQFNGMKFDSGFSPTHHISITGGGGQSTPSGYGLFVNAGRTAGVGGNAMDGDYLGGNDGQNGGALNLFGGNNWLGALVAINNSNTAGVDGSGLGTGPAGVLTGIEVQIPLASLGVASANGLKIAAFVNGANWDYLSNQVLGGLPAGTGNLGGDGAGNYNGSVGGIDFTQFAGNQYVTIVPTPGVVSVIGLAGLAAARRRRA